MVKNYADWGVGTPSDSGADSDMGMFSDDDAGSDDGVVIVNTSAMEDTSSPSLSGSPNNAAGPSTVAPQPPKSQQQQRPPRSFNGTSTRLTGVGYVSESESDFGVLPYRYTAQTFPDNDDGSEEEYQFYTAVEDNAERGIEMIPCHEHCWEEFMKALRFWCEDAGVKLCDAAGKWWVTSDVVWRFFTIGYWDSAVDERLQMVRWPYGRRITENHEKGRWEVRKGEGVSRSSFILGGGRGLSELSLTVENSSGG